VVLVPSPPPPIGSSEIVIVGVKLGELDGLIGVGSKEGMEEGSLVGAKDGTTVGKSVGGMDGSDDG